MDKQLKLFAVQEPLFEEITNDWLLEYLKNEYSIKSCTTLQGMVKRV